MFKASVGEQITGSRLIISKSVPFSRSKNLHVSEASFCVSVVLPDCRGPMMGSTGKILRYSKNNAQLVRFIMPFPNVVFDLGYAISGFSSVVK